MNKERQKMNNRDITRTIKERGNVERERERDRERERTYTYVHQDMSKPKCCLMRIMEESGNGKKRP